LRLQTVPRMNACGRRSSTLAIVFSVLAISSVAQTRITAPSNKYSPAEDVQLGREAAAQAEQQLPILRDELLTSYVHNVGRRLVDVIPSELRHPEFEYTFKLVNVREINAFALPGGPMYVNRGMIEAAKNEGEVAGVMAHELSHIILRHGTAQASKATKYEIGAIAGQVIGAIIGGNVGSIVAQGSQFGLGAAFMRFSREYERQADIEGAQIMAHAGYDPRDMANMFKTIETQGGGSGLPEWLSDHPDPGNRYEYISREAQTLRVTDPVRDTRGFEQARAKLKDMSPAPTTAEAVRNAENRPRETSGTATLGRVEAPSNRFVTYRAGTLFQVNVPDNWRQLPGSRSVTFAPQGGYATSDRQSVFTHGVEAGEAPAGARDLQSATEGLLASLAQANPGLQRSSNSEATNVGDRRGTRIELSNRSEVTGQPERINLYTTLLPDGHLFYVVAVAPQGDFTEYQRTFSKIVSSLKLANHR
jgi:beta-barrel assembly-enhancing protease